MHVSTTAPSSRARSANTPTTLEHHGVPPPLALELFDSDQHVGWVRADALGFGGFATANEAGHGAWVAYRAIWRRHAKQHGLRPHPVVPTPIELRSMGDRDLILASGRPFATLIRPASDADGANSFGFEIRLPAPVDELSARSAAYLVYRTLRKSGIRWTLWVRDAASEVAPRGTAARMKEGVRRVSARTPIQLATASGG